MNPGRRRMGSVKLTFTTSENMGCELNDSKVKGTGRSVMPVGTSADHPYAELLLKIAVWTL
jgi:hypothetical protein